MILNPSRRPAWLRYAVAALAVIAASVIRLWFLDGLGLRAPYITFSPAVILAALYGGLGAGLLATALSAGVAAFFLIEPAGSFSIAQPSDALGLGVFCVSGALISWITAAMHRAQARAVEAEAQAQVALERGRSADELREMAQLLAYHVENTPLAVIEWGPDMRLIRWSGEAERIFGWSAGEVLGKRMEDFRWIYAEDATQVAEVSAGLQDGTAPRRFSANRNYRKDGSVAYCEWYNSSLVDAAGKLRSILSLALDVTERKRVEEELRRQREWLGVTLSSIGDAVLATDTTGKITFLNPVAAGLTGWSGPQALGRPVREVFRIINEQTREEAEDIVERVLREGRVVQLANSTALVTRGNSEIPIEDSAAPIRDAAGSVSGAVLVFHDVSEKRRALKGLRRVSDQRRLALEAAEMGAWEFRLETGEVLWDERCCEIAGVPAGERAPFGERLALIHPDDRAAVEEAMRGAIAGAGGGAYHQEFRTVWPDGSLRWVANHGRAYFEGEGDRRHAVRFVGVSLDITERKRAEEALRENERRLLEAQKLESIGVLAGGVAHDFNNLLVGVVGNASLAQDLLPPDNPAADLLEGILKTGGQLAHLTRQMLAYSGKGRFVVESLNLSDLIAEMRSLVQPAIPKKVTLRLELASDLPNVEADRAQVQQVFMNLAINAAEAIGAGAGAITVRTGVQDVDDLYARSRPETAGLRPGKYVCLEVRDTGCGMEEDTRVKVFDPFFSTKFLGRGLGLAAVAGIVRGHDGAVMVRSAPGEGSCFTVLFPAAGRVSAAPPPETAGDIHGSGTVLVVDDEELVRAIAKRALELFGYRVLVADGGLAAIDVLKRHAGGIAAVVLDLSMPGMSGQEALPEILKIRPEAKVVVSSGYSESETMRLFQGQRVAGFIQKPYTAEGLARKLQATIATR